MKISASPRLVGAALLALLSVSTGRAASVGPSGYTNDFTVWPVPADWATVSIAGSSATVYDLDTDVATNVMYSAAVVGFQVVSNGTAAPTVPAQLTNAIWSSAGSYVQTRPNTSRATALMGKFVNNTGTNAAEIRIAYQLQLTGTLAVEDVGNGTHVYYSLSGAAGSWVPLAALNIHTNTGTFQLSTNLALTWGNTSNLFLLWADDNTATGVDAASQYDNFSLTITPALPSCTLLFPTNNGSYFFYDPVPFSALADPGPGGATLTGVGFFDVTTGLLTNLFTAPYTNQLSLAPGSYSIYAVATNSSGLELFSATNAVAVIIPPTNTVPPTIAGQTPLAGASITNLTSIQILFSETVTNVNAADLRVNGAAATNVTGIASNYTFIFPQPAFGTVTVQFAPGHGITDLGYPANLSFDENGAGAAWTYNLLDTIPPVVSARSPAGATVTNLAQIAVTFSENVTGVNAADLLVNGAPATNFSGAGSNFVFTFPVQSPGALAITWAGGHGIQDLSGNAFNPATAGNTWNYTQVDQVPPTVVAQNPAAGSFVPSLTSVTVNFSESVAGVNAGDLLVNGLAAVAVSGGPTNYTFTLPGLNATSVNVTWISTHGITDLGVPASAFNATGPGATWSYTTTDTAAPRATVFPTPSLAVSRLTHLNVSFDEPVSGVNAADLLINGSPATNATGSGAGPYLFTFPEPPTGTVAVAWAAGHGITDQSPAPNAFAGGAWSYTLDPTLPGDYVLRHVVQMSLDGLAAVHLRFYVTNAPGQFPNFVRLINEGAWTMNARCDYEYSETVPNHSTMFMARPVAQPAGAPNTVHHGYNNNFPAGTDTFHNSGNTNVPYKSSMMDVAHDYGRSTALYTGKTRLDICDRSYNAANGAPDLIGVNNGPDKIDFSSIADVSGTSISNEVTQLITNLASATPRHYSFIHIAEPDLTGHSSGWGSANWSNAVRNVDREIGRILNAIDTNPVLSNQTALIVTADHGGGGVTANAHTEAFHPNNFTIPFFVRAPGIRPGTDAYALFANRGNPGTNRTDYNTQPQPVRNGDASNLALSFLGLPPIPGSSIVPSLNTPLNTLRVARFGSLTTVFWYDPNNSSVLEVADSFTAPVFWHAVTNGVILNETTKSYSETNGVDAHQFFRVRKL